MTLKVPAVVSWDLDTVITQVANLRSDEGLFLDSAEAVWSAAGQNLGGFAGNTITAATQGCGALSRDITIVARKAASVVKALTDFCDRAPELRSTLMVALDDAAAALCEVADDGTVRGPLLIGDPSDPAVIKAHEENDEIAAGIEKRIQPLLRGLEELDLAAANALNLMSMTESYVSYPYDPDEVEVDPRTVAAGGTISLATGATSFAAEAMDASSGIVRRLPVFGTGLGLVLGLATSSADESFGETLAIEGSGILAAVGATALTSAASGAIVGSTVPGPGTVGGFVVGGIVGTAASVGTTTFLRGHINEQRADGKKGFQW